MNFLRTNVQCILDRKLLKIYIRILVQIFYMIDTLLMLLLIHIHMNNIIDQKILIIQIILQTEDLIGINLIQYNYLDYNNK
jgi:hypothetical protein